MARSSISRRFGQIGGPTLIAVAFVGLAARGWRRWPDIQIDFGHQLYIPWQLSEGKVLYRDIYCLFGPLSQYLNAFWFDVFGVSLTTLIFCNLAILAAVTALVYRMFARLFDDLTATVCCLVLLSMFAFGHLTYMGNYNFVTPYSHESTHGTALAIVMLYALFSAFADDRRMGIPVAGFCLGLTLLTKPEIATAAAVAAATTLALNAWLAPGRARRLWSHLMALGVGASGALLAAFALLWAEMGPGLAARALVAAWTPLFESSLATSAFYEIQSGLDRPLANAIAMIGGAARFAVAIGAAALVELAIPRQRHAGIVTLGTGAAALAVGHAWGADGASWGNLARGLPLVGIAMVGLLIAALVRARGSRREADRLVALVAWAVLALVYQGKILLFARIHHYGFYLSLPLVLLLVALLVGGIPGYLSRRGRGAAFRGVALGLVAAASFSHLQTSDAYYQMKKLKVGNGGDTIFTYTWDVRPVGWGFERARQKIEDMVPDDATLLALPYGIMLNYQTRRVNPTPWVQFTDGAFILWEERTLIESLSRAPPDVVAIIHVEPDNPESGYFGRDPRNGLELARWIRTHYVRVERIGAEPFVSGEFGIDILMPRDVVRVPRFQRPAESATP